MAKSKIAIFLLLFLLLVYLAIVSNKGNKTKTPQVNSTNPVDILVIEGNKLADRQDYSHAIDKYYEALKLDQNCYLCYYNLARVYCDMRDYGSCVSCLESTARLKPEWPLPYEFLGEIYFKFKSSFKDGLNKAIANYKKAVELEPSKIEIHLKLAECYEYGGEGRYAEKEYETILKIDPSNSTALTSLNRLRNSVYSK